MPKNDDFRLDLNWTAQHGFNFMRGTAEWQRPYFVEIDGEMTDAAVTAVADYLHNPAKTKSIVEHNYQLGQKHLSYQTLESLLLHNF